MYDVHASRIRQATDARYKQERARLVRPLLKYIKIAEEETRRSERVEEKIKRAEEFVWTGGFEALVTLYFNKILEPVLGTDEYVKYVYREQQNVVYKKLHNGNTAKVMYDFDMIAIVVNGEGKVTRVVLADVKKSMTKNTLDDLHHNLLDRAALIKQAFWELSQDDKRYEYLNNIEIIALAIAPARNLTTFEEKLWWMESEAIQYHVKFLMFDSSVLMSALAKMYSALALSENFKVDDVVNAEFAYARASFADCLIDFDKYFHSRLVSVKTHVDENLYANISKIPVV